MKYVMIIMVLFVLFSCRTTKNTQRSEVKTDSAHVTKKDSGSVKKENTAEQVASKVTTVKEETKDRTITTTVEEFKVPDTLREPVIVRRTTVVDVNKGKKKSERTKTDTLHKSTAKSDSTFNYKSDSTKLAKDEKIKTVEVVKTSGGGWINAGLILLAIIIIIIIGYLLYKKFKMKLLIFLLLISSSCLGQISACPKGHICGPCSDPGFSPKLTKVKELPRPAETCGIALAPDSLIEADVKLRHDRDCKICKRKSTGYIPLPAIVYDPFHDHDWTELLQENNAYHPLSNTVDCLIRPRIIYCRKCLIISSERKNVIDYKRSQ